MNIAHILTPKILVAYLYDDCSIRQGLEKMKYHGYASIPVITREGLYAGTISEGDFLWHLLGERDSPIPDLRSLENLPISAVPRRARIQPVQITADMQTLLRQSAEQNFIPVIDDRNAFIGIVTRRQILQYYAKCQEPAFQTPSPEGTQKETEKK